MNTRILRLLEHAVGLDARAARLRRDATWSDEEFAEFEDTLEAQRNVGLTR